MSDEKKQGRVAQIRQSYQAIRSLDSRIGWYMLLASVLTLAVIAGIGFAIGGFWRWYMILVAIPAAALAAVIVMNRRGNTAMYNALDGQPGAAGAALMGMGKRGWFTSEQPVAVEATRGTKMTDMSGAAMVFRALGRPGIVLIGEGPEGRVQKLLKAEEKKVARVAQGVPMWCGGMLETGIGRAHNIHLATMPGFVYPGDTASASRTYARDITEQQLEATNGIMPVPEGAGIGVTLDRPYLDEVTRSVEVLKP